MRRRYPSHPILGVGAIIFTRAGRRGPILLVERGLIIGVMGKRDAGLVDHLSILIGL